MEQNSKKQFYSSLPRKRSAVGVLIFQDEKLLVLEPTYKPNWLVPGGVVDKSESPYEAALRECKEEIGLDVKIVDFLCADYKRGNIEIGDAVHFLFLGKISSDAKIIVDQKEIKEFYWMTPFEAVLKFDVHLSTRVKVGIRAIHERRPFYCEEGEVVV
ncbi:MAG: hypothetical protein A2622_13765 [Bdellovibrionales bacterium RIFCSPHIGHO2_01_FULL_40_29]|nr:MAG: hypothetical protein A2622_13765 [Bdellovibrionales bacterium RIFCSPHIGHO2_01_FULL_40_29]OFZ35218.1 MAG: hypothetical protein A3D17_14415 [Bdellovibrionales bacterium RIFCSPHIGHO2_02_FULL_40_15]